ncbi:MAG: hypothetical protein QOJ99_4295 [Bryobacterales bacterium]|jgi:hypothetical protein|nr:hypothetical protein [Bryobacterales bacterium]
MIPVECEFEAEVLAAVVQSRWPERTDPALRAHVAGCVICSDVAAVAGALDGSGEEIRYRAVVPDSGRVWWLAQMRARREAARTAGRPITAAQVLAFACAIGLLGACFGATSTWFQGAMLEWRGVLAAAFTEHAGLTALAVALVLVVPGAVYWIVVRD